VVLGILKTALKVSSIGGLGKHLCQWKIYGYADYKKEYEIPVEKEI
jgi:hypothetical protein